MLELQVPFFEPLWSRVLVTAICRGWAGFQALTGAPFWSILFGALGVYCAYQFFVVWNPKEKTE